VSRRFHAPFVRSVSLCAVLTCCLVSLPTAQTPRPAQRVIDATVLHVNVANLDDSLGFYRDVLGMEKYEDGALRAGEFLGGEPGGKLRSARVRVPGGLFSMEIVEWSGVPLRPEHRNFNDPGAIMLAFDVRDYDTKLAGAKKLGWTVITRNGVPEVSNGRRSIMLHDPNGYIVELTDVAANSGLAADALPGAITRAVLWITVRDLDETVKFYKETFGLDFPNPPAGPPLDRVKALYNAPTLTKMRTARGSFPGIDFPSIGFQEFTGPERQRPLRHRVMDPGGPTIPVTVKAEDFGAVMAAVRSNGGLIGQGEASEALPANARATWIRDPNGLLFRVGTPAPARAGRGGQRAGGNSGNLFPPFSNLQVLPRDIDQQQLLQIMLGYESALGITCEHCHVDFGRGNPMNDFASDAKPPKKTARVMMTMLRDINQKLSSSIGKAPADITSVQCGTCHRGKAIPEYVAPPPPPQPGALQGGGRRGAQ
jgi:catechol 2,3-dioxygenase-like lactoylglutathione lyase family enzyme